MPDRRRGRPSNPRFDRPCRRRSLPAPWRARLRATPVRRRPRCAAVCRDTQDRRRDETERAHGCRAAYARVPVNGKLPIGPMPISPLMLSPETVPMNSSVNGIGLVIETFQLTASPLMVPSKISAVLPSAPCVPVSVPPAARQAQRRLALAHGGRHGQSPVAVHGHSRLPTYSRRPATIRQARPATYSATRRVAPNAPLTRPQARAAARMRLLTRRRKTTYWTAKATILAPTATTEM